MNRPVDGQRRAGGTGALRIGLFGLLGSGNIGNDGSLESVLNYLRDRDPDALLEVMCSGPDVITARYGVPATSLLRFRSEFRTASGPVAIARKVLGKIVDAVRTLLWVRRHDVVIVPGMGVLEATTPLRPWGFPYTLFLLCASGRLVGARVLLVGVGADPIDNRVIRWLMTCSARMASYRSFRDAHSRDAITLMGVDTSADEVYPDLAFALPTPAASRHPTGVVGVGVMAYRGGDVDRGSADEIHAAYVEAMKSFVRWLVDGGRAVCLLTGDRQDDEVVQEILADVRGCRPVHVAAQVMAKTANSLDEFMRRVAAVDTVVATRYHNVLCALKMSTPTLSVGYATKHEVLMADMGLGEFCHSARWPDVPRLIEQFVALEDRSEELRATMLRGNQENTRLLARQFDAIGAVLRRCSEVAPAVPGAATAPGGS
jgi:polysaccharide pyruvyl transferase WcaK-like protein